MDASQHIRQTRGNNTNRGTRLLQVMAMTVQNMYAILGWKMTDFTLADVSKLRSLALCFFTSLHSGQTSDL
jgi:hypothetical protein